MKRSGAWARLWGLCVALLLVVSCDDDHSHSSGGGHDDGHGHGQDDGHGHGASEEGDQVEPLSITRWTDDHELFVEFAPPMPGKPVRYLAHVTRLSDFQAIEEGTFYVFYHSDSGVAAKAKVDGVARAGIFIPEGPAPAAGAYELEMVYEHEGKRDVFDCGTVQVAGGPSAAAEDGPSAPLSFLKETQWKIPFATAWAKKRKLAKEIELPAVVEPAGADQLTVGAPTDGRFFHNPDLSLAEGLRIEKGDVIGSIVPTVAGDDYSRLRTAVDDAKLAVEQGEIEIRRVQPLVEDGLLPKRRLIQLRNEQDRATARLGAARRRLGQVMAPGGAGGLRIRSTQAGVVSQVLVSNGEPVDSGAPLVRIGGTLQLWIRARFVARPEQDLADARPAAVRLPSGQRLELGAKGARLLSRLPVVDPSSRLATWIVEVENGGAVAADKASAPSKAGEPGGELPSARPESADSLRTGTPVVLLMRVGSEREVLAVSRSAVVELNTRPFVFVQAEGESFEKRLVGLGDVDGPFVEIRSGVGVGDRIVTKGGFDVHLASLAGALESHRH